MTSRPPRPGRRHRGALLVLLAVVLLVAGAVLATVARPAQEAVLDVGAAAAGEGGTAPLLVLEPSVVGELAGDAGDVVVRASGPGAVLLAAGRDDDVDAWAEGAGAVVVSADDDGSPTARSTAGEATAPDPAGSDLWTAQARGTGSAELVVDTAAGTTAVLVAADGTAPAPTAVEVVGQHRPVPVVAWVSLGAGALLLTAALARGRGSRSRRRPVVVQLPETAPVPQASPSPLLPDDQLEVAPLRRPRGRRAAR